MCKFDSNSPNWSWFLKSFIKLESLQTEIEKLLIFQRIPPTSNFLIRVFIFVKCRQWQYWQISFMQSQAHLDTNHSTFSSSLKIGQFKEKDCRRMKSLKYRGVLFVCFIKYLRTWVIFPPCPQKVFPIWPVSMTGKVSPHTGVVQNRSLNPNLTVNFSTMIIVTPKRVSVTFGSNNLGSRPNSLTRSIKLLPFTGQNSRILLLNLNEPCPFFHPTKMRLLLTLWKFYFWRQIGTEVLATLCSTIPFWSLCSPEVKSLRSFSQFLTVTGSSKSLYSCLCSHCHQRCPEPASPEENETENSEPHPGPVTLTWSLFFVNRTVYTSIRSHQNWILTHRFPPPLPPTSHCPSSGWDGPVGNCGSPQWFYYLHFCYINQTHGRGRSWEVSCVFFGGRGVVVVALSQKIDWWPD